MNKSTFIANKTPTYQGWQPYPQNKPADTDEAKLKDYVALVPNPNFINKFAYRNNIKRFAVRIVFWLGDRFVDDFCQPLNVHYFIELPSHS